MRITKDPDVRKKEIVDLARDLFSKEGYKKVSIKEIISNTDSSGSPGMFYYYFKSKADIYNAVINQMVDEQISRRQSLLNVSEKNNEDPKETVSKLLDLIQTDAGDFKKLNLQKVDKDLLDEVSKRLIKAEQEMVEKLINRLLNNHLLPTNKLINFDSSKYITQFIIYGTNGILQNLKPDEDQTDALKYIKMFINQMLDLKLSK